MGRTQILWLPCSECGASDSVAGPTAMSTRACCSYHTRHHITSFSKTIGPAATLFVSLSRRFLRKFSKVCCHVSFRACSAQVVAAARTAVLSVDRHVDYVVPCSSGPPVVPRPTCCSCARVCQLASLSLSCPFLNSVLTVHLHWAAMYQRQFTRLSGTVPTRLVPAREVV